MASSASQKLPQNAPKSTLKKGNDGGILKKTEQERNEAFDEYFEVNKLIKSYLTQHDFILF
jgi:hypothetical protein